MTSRSAEPSSRNILRFPFSSLKPQYLLMKLEYSFQETAPQWQMSDFVSCSKQWRKMKQGVPRCLGGSRLCKILVFFFWKPCVFQRYAAPANSTCVCLCVLEGWVVQIRERGQSRMFSSMRLNPSLKIGNSPSVFSRSSISSCLSPLANLFDYAKPHLQKLLELSEDQLVHRAQLSHFKVKSPVAEPKNVYLTRPFNYRNPAVLTAD